MLCVFAGVTAVQMTQVQASVPDHLLLWQQHISMLPDTLLCG